MAKPQVTLTFAGDSTQLERSFDRVGASAREMSQEVGSASQPVRDLGGSFDSAAEATDTVDTRAMGFRDTITGLQDSFKGLTDDSLSLGDRLLTLGMGVGDLASGFTNFLIPSVKSLTTGMIQNTVQTAKSTAASVAHRTATIAQTVATNAATVAQKALNVALRANPIGIVITVLAALAAAVYVAYQRSETFRKIVNAAFGTVAAAGRAVGSAVSSGMGVVRDAVGGAASWVSDQVGRIVGFFTGLPGRVRSGMSSLGSAISSPFRSALNGLRSVWNSTVGRVSFRIPDWVPGIGGRGWSFPKMHTGGIVPGAPGTEQLTLLQAGERVTPAGRVPGMDEGGDEPITVNVMLSREAIAGIAQVEIKKGNRLVKRAVMSGATRAVPA